MKNKIGLGIITCNKPDRLAQSIKTVPGDDYIDCLVIVNDGEPYDSSLYPAGAHVIQHETNKCVGPSKNDALKYLMDQDCDHLFIMEDDVLIKDPDVFKQYIKTAQATGIWHLNYALQGPANRKQTHQGPMDVEKRHELDQEGEPNPRGVIEYKDGVRLALYPNSVGAFSYYYKGVIKAVGYNDEVFKNAWEHVEHTYRIIKAGLHPPFWWFADIADVDKYLDSIPGCIENSTIAHTPEWIENFRKGMVHYEQKHGWAPQCTPQATIQQVELALREIADKYSKEVL